jgi:hypothetical protein
MAFNEIDRVALYWPKRGVQKLRTDRRGRHWRSSKTTPSAGTEILEGGCKLYRLFQVVDARNRSTRERG